MRLSNCRESAQKSGGDDTLVRMSKLRDLCTAEPEHGDEEKVLYIVQELVFVCDELEEVLEEDSEKVLIYRLLHGMKCIMRPPVMYVVDGKRYRPNIRTRMAMNRPKFCGCK
ncbi:MAG: hypothetical protein MJZ38_03990 [archaeon]|nr:hypothetical protein [archaeon]